jgi:hypothetical protein
LQKRYKTLLLAFGLWERDINIPSMSNENKAKTQHVTQLLHRHSVMGRWLSLFILSVLLKMHGLFFGSQL